MSAFVSQEKVAKMAAVSGSRCMQMPDKNSGNDNGISFDWKIILAFCELLF